MTHDPLCPCNVCTCTHAECCECSDPVWCQCDLIREVRANERAYILNVAADTIKPHQIIDGRCLCGSLVDDIDQHRDDIIRRYVATALTREGQELAQLP